MEEYKKVTREVYQKNEELWYSFLQDLKDGLFLTCKYLFKKKVTMQYPYEKSTKDWSIPLRWRGLHALAVDEPAGLMHHVLQCAKSP